MEYERKYKAALKWMQSLYSGLHGATKEEAEKYFPELKDSEDERIVKCLLNYFNHVRYNGLDLKGTDIDEVIVWLEKQGKQKSSDFSDIRTWKYIVDMVLTEKDGIGNYLDNPDTERIAKKLQEKYGNIEKQGEKVTNINGEDCGIDGLYHAIKILERTIGRVTGYQSDDGILSHEAAINAVKELYKKQGGQEHFYDFNANDWYVSKVDGKIHNMKYNPTDKVEPKFKVGDFITNDYCLGKVIEITNDAYLLDTGQGIPFSCEHNAHLWTIEDAKDGDVLVTTAIRNCPFIYRKTGYNNNLAYYYAGIDGSGDFCEGCIKRTSYHFGPLSNVVPATKEQRDQLFQKMVEAGYEWDSDNKELKKMSQRHFIPIR